MQYHPDKVAHLGDEFRGIAEEKMKEINAAYDFFKKQ
jgi:DnaJ like chaperone protein